MPEYPPEALADVLIEEIPIAVPWGVVADILGILIWSTEDNGASIMRTAEKWLLEAQNLRRIQVALNLDVYPFKTNDQMQRVLFEVVQRFSEVDLICRALIDSRARLPE